MLSTLGYTALRAARIPALSRRFHSGGAVLCYHNVVRGRHTAVGGDPGLHLSVDRFADQLRWLVGRYAVIPLHEVVERIRQGRPLRGTIALTFDDGYRGVTELALPVLRELRLPATVFVVGSAPGSGLPFWWDHPDVVRRIDGTARQRWLEELGGDRDRILASLGVEEVTAVAEEFRPDRWHALLAATVQGIEIGAHSMHHRVLSTLSDEEIEADLIACREVIAARTGQTPAFLAYPYGVWDPRVREVARRVGFTGAVTLDAGLNRTGTDPWALKRVNVPAGIGPAAFECWVAGLHP